MLLLELHLPGLDQVTVTDDVVIPSWTHALLLIDQLAKCEAAASDSATPVANLLQTVPKTVQTILRLATILTIHSVQKVARALLIVPLTDHTRLEQSNECKWLGPSPSKPAAPSTIPRASASISSAVTSTAVCLELGCECRAAGAGCRCSGHSHR